MQEKTTKYTLTEQQYQRMYEEGTKLAIEQGCPEMFIKDYAKGYVEGFEQSVKIYEELKQGVPLDELIVKYKLSDKTAELYRKTLGDTSAN